MRLAPVLLAGTLLLSGCGAAEEPTPTPRPTPTASPPTVTSTVQPTPTPTPTPTPKPGTYPPAWLGKRILPKRPDGFGVMGPTPPELRTRRFTLPDRLGMLPGQGFQSRSSAVPDSVLARSTWARGCPVGRADLAWVRLTFWGFDSARHTGELLVNRRVAGDVVNVFHDLYDARFPMEELRITRKDEQTAPPTGDGNDTGAFNCRPKVGQTSFSEHAYGLAIDINPFQNPYTVRDVVLPELARAYLDRSRRAPGVIHPGDVVTRAFARIGWGWGGDWQHSKDYQHFSENGQ